MTIYQLATEAGQQIAVLDYEEHLHESVMQCKSAKEICQLWADFLIDNQDDEAFRLRVNHAGNISDLIKWADNARSILSIGP